MKSRILRCRYGGLAIAIAVFALDQWTKSFIIKVADDGAYPLEIFSFFNLVLVWNRGISFGLLGHAPGSSLQVWLPQLLTFGTLCIVFGLLIWLVRATERPVTIALGFIIGGAMGNIIDRIRHGAVADFLDFHYEQWHWPAFNIGDSAIFIGVVILLLLSIVKR